MPKYGGCGGNGGAVVVMATDENENTLGKVLMKYTAVTVKASNGTDAHARCIIGRRGKDHCIEVPVGIEVHTLEGQKLGDLNKLGDKVVVANGGLGGRKETGYSGIAGEVRKIRLDLKLIADIGLVGFPNAGKSTLLKAITNANPKIASYPFTTLRPNIGIMEFDDLRQISIADLPGLIEGAHVNIGMGHDFLRHVERTKMLLFMVDVEGFQLNKKFEHRTCVDTVVLLNRELELYREHLLDKPAVLLVNKMDKEGAEEHFNEIEASLHNMQETIQNYPDKVRPTRAVRFDEIIPVSVKTSANDVEKIKKNLRELLDINAASEENYVGKENALLEGLRKVQREYGPRMV